MSKVFISHSSKDKPRIESLREFLEVDDIPYWVDDQGILVGDDAPKELRAAIQDCACCIFYATRNSLDSQWCLIETAAFWGAGRTVLAYLAEPDVTREKLPEHLRNASPSTSLKAVRERAAKLVQEARRAVVAPPPPAVVAAVALEDAIRRAVGMTQVQRALQDRLLLVRGMLAIGDEIGEGNEGFLAVLDGHLAALRGFTRQELTDACLMQWPYHLTVVNSGGDAFSLLAGRRTVDGQTVRLGPSLVLAFTGDYSDGAAVLRKVTATAGKIEDLEVVRTSGNAGFEGALQCVDAPTATDSTGSVTWQTGRA